MEKNVAKIYKSMTRLREAVSKLETTETQLRELYISRVQFRIALTLNNSQKTKISKYTLFWAQELLSWDFDTVLTYIKNANLLNKHNRKLIPKMVDENIQKVNELVLRKWWNSLEFTEYKSLFIWVSTPRHTHKDVLDSLRDNYTQLKDQLNP